VILSFVFRIPSLESGIERGPEKVQRLSEQKTGTEQRPRYLRILAGKRVLKMLVFCRK
jgi:hypothetical protein